MIRYFCFVVFVRPMVKFLQYMAAMELIIKYGHTQGNHEYSKFFSGCNDG